METCTSCGAKAEKLVTVFPGAKVGDGLPFCFDCVEFGACELPFLARRRLSRRELLRSALRNNCDVLQALRRTRSRSAALEARIAELEETLDGGDGP